MAEPKPIADALAGLTVGFSLLSKAIASSAIAGVDPLVGLWSSWACLTLRHAPWHHLGCGGGGRRAARSHGRHARHKIHPTDHLLVCHFRGHLWRLPAGEATRFISESVLNLNGLGGLLFMSQLKVFTSAPAFMPAVTCAAICATITELLPRFKSMPASLKGQGCAGLACGACRRNGGGHSERPATQDARVEGTPVHVLGGLSALPKFIDFGQFAAMFTSVPALKIAVPVAMSIAFISIIETLLAAKVVDDMKGVMKGESLCTPGNLCALPGG